MTVEKYISGTVFGDTKRPHQHIKEFYPNAKFVPVCAHGFYYTVYEDNTETKVVAYYMYLKNRDVITREARKESKPFGQFFKLVWEK
jgi:hypothetical protein